MGLRDRGAGDELLVGSGEAETTAESGDGAAPAFPSRCASGAGNSDSVRGGGSDEASETDGRMVAGADPARVAFDAFSCSLADGSSPSPRPLPICRTPQLPEDPPRPSFSTSSPTIRKSRSRAVSFFPP